MELLASTSESGMCEEGRRDSFPNFPEVTRKKRIALLCSSNRLRDIESSAQGHTAREWLGQELSQVEAASTQHLCNNDVILL